MKLKIISPILGWIIIALVILGVSIYFLSGSNSRVVTGPNIITITEGTQGFKSGLRIGVVNIQSGSAVISLSSEPDNISENVKTGDNFDFQNYHIQVIEVKENTKILPAGFTGGSNGFVTLEITQK